MVLLDVVTVATPLVAAPETTVVLAVLLLPRTLAPIPIPKQQHIHIGIAIMMSIHMMNDAMTPPIIAPILPAAMYNIKLDFGIDTGPYCQKERLDYQHIGMCSKYCMMQYKKSQIL